MQSRWAFTYPLFDKLKREVYLWEHGTLGVAVIDTVQAVNIAISIRGIIKRELIPILL